MLDLIDLPTRSVASVHRIGGFGETRSGDGEETPLFYVVNFEEEEGFALLSGDTRTPPVFCITEYGTLSPHELPDNPGLGIMLSMYDTDYRLAVGLPTLDENGEWREPVTIQTPYSWDSDTMYPIDVTGDEPPSERYVYGAWTNYTSIGTKIPVKWGQDNPYNTLTPVIGSDHAPTGCGAVAAAIIMSHYSKPNTYNGYTFTWSEMNRHISNSASYGVNYQPGHSMIARLMHQINLPANYDASYGANLTTTTLSRSEKVFKNFGYASGGSKKDYNWSSLKSAIAAGRPSLVRGDDIKKQTVWAGIVWDTWYSGGHVWVVDQIMTQRRQVLVYDRFTGVLKRMYYETREMMHCNWGWDGMDNGYFYPSRFDSNNVPVPDGTRGTVTYGTDYFYQYKLAMNTGIRWS